MVGGGQGWAGLAESVSASSLSMSAAVFDPLDSHEDGIVTAKLRPKEDSDCRSFWSSASVQIRSRQDDQLERAFKVESPQAIGRRPM